VLRTFSAAVAIATLIGCSYDPDVPDQDPPQVAAMNGFSWVINHTLAGMPRPGARSTLDQDLDFLADQNIDLLVSLTEDGTDPVAAARHGITVLHLPVRDFTAPSVAQLLEFTSAAETAIEGGRTVGVHCGAGLGRTGTFLAAFFVTTGMTADAAIAHVRMLRPGSIETEAQAEAVHALAASLGQDPPSAPPPTEL
jgi:atypical dual specificity phosphatase